MRMRTIALDQSCAYAHSLVMPNANPAARKTEPRRAARVHAMPGPKLALAPLEELPVPGEMLSKLLDQVSAQLTTSRNHLVNCEATLQGRLVDGPDADASAKLAAVEAASARLMEAIIALRGAL